MKASNAAKGVTCNIYIILSNYYLGEHMSMIWTLALSNDNSPMLKMTKDVNMSIFLCTRSIFHQGNSTDL